jgi:hypothetical protein
MVGHLPLEEGIGVRVPGRQQKSVQQFFGSLGQGLEGEFWGPASTRGWTSRAERSYDATASGRALGLVWPAASLR